MRAAKPHVRDQMDAVFDCSQIITMKHSFVTDQTSFPHKNFYFVARKYKERSKWWINFRLVTMKSYLWSR